MMKSIRDNLTKLFDLKIAQSAAVAVDRLANDLSEINFNEKDYKSKVGRQFASEFAASGGLSSYISPAVFSSCGWHFLVVFI